MKWLIGVVVVIAATPAIAVYAAAQSKADAKAAQAFDSSLCELGLSSLQTIKATGAEYVGALSWKSAVFIVKDCAKKDKDFAAKAAPYIN